MNSQDIALLARQNRVSKWATNWLAWGVLIFLCGYFLAPTKGAQQTWFYLVVLLPALMLVPFINWKLFYGARPSVLLLVLLLLWMVAASLWGNQGAVWEQAKYAIFVFSLLIGFEIALEKNENFEKYLFMFFVISAGIFSLVLLFQYFQQNGLTGEVLLPDRDRYLNQNRAGRVFGAAVILAVTAALVAKDKYMKILFVFIALCCLLVTALTQSAGSFGSLIVVAGLVPGILYIKKYPRITITIYLLLGAVVILFFWTGAFKVIMTEGWSKRDLIWAGAWENLKGMPFYGYGIPESTRVLGSGGETYGHLHNIYLTVLMYSGYPGLILFVSYLIYLIVFAMKNNSLQNVTYLALLLYGMSALTWAGKYPLSRPNEAWLVLWVPALLLTAKTRCLVESRGSTS